MIDPITAGSAGIGVASLALQLLGGCIKGFIILSTARAIGKDASTIVCMLELQEVQLIEWARRAGLLSGNGVLDPRLNNSAIETALQQLQTLLSDATHLRKKYGLEIVPAALINQSASNPTDAALPDLPRVFTSISTETRNRIIGMARVAHDVSAIQKFRWAVIDKKKIEHLVKDVHFLVRELWHFLDPWRHDDLVESFKVMSENIVSLNSNFYQLKALSDALSTLPEATSLQTQLVFRNVAVSADVKALAVALDNGEADIGPGTETIRPTRKDLLRDLERLYDSKLSDFKPRSKNELMGLAAYDGAKVFVEKKIIEARDQSTILRRVENLAALLNIPKTETFQSLHCKGIVEQRDEISFIFDYPANSLRTEPQSLLDLFSSKTGIRPPSLSKRIKLALTIAEALQQFHRAEWLHKSLRSENILFFEGLDGSLESPILAGFQYSRSWPPPARSDRPSRNPGHDIYRHPQALGEPLVSFSPIMDIYSLGTILFEIAEWRALRYLVDSVVKVDDNHVPLTTVSQVQDFLISGGKNGISQLESRVGDVYTRACVMCLRGEVDAGLHITGQTNVLDVVVNQLRSCHV